MLANYLERCSLNLIEGDKRSPYHRQISLQSLDLLLLLIHSPLALSFNDSIFNSYVYNEIKALKKIHIP